MVKTVYNLPEISFIGGETQNILFVLERDDGRPFNASDCEVNFAITHFSNNDGFPIIEKPAIIKPNNDGLYNLVNVQLSPQETCEMFGRYVYQLTLKDQYNNCNIPGQGIIRIVKNIDKDYIL